MKLHSKSHMDPKLTTLLNLILEKGDQFTGLCVETAGLFMGDFPISPFFLNISSWKKGTFLH